MKSGSTIQLVHDLLALQRARATGALTVTADDVSTIVYFREGRAVFAEEGTLNDTLGRLLVAEGAINQEQYAKAVELMQQYLAINHSVRMGEVLVSLGYLTVEDIQNALISQASKRIARLMQFPALSWQLDRASPRLDQVPNYPMRVEPRILLGIATYYDRPVMRRLLGSYLGSYTMLRADVALIARCFDLTPPQVARIGGLDGSKSLEEWLEDEDAEEAWWLATALAMTGVLAAAPTRPTPIEIELASNENPSLAPPGSTGAFEVALVRSGAIVKPALPNVINVPEDPETRARRERLDAESALQRGLELLEVGHYRDAANAFRDAAQVMPNAMEYQLYRAWADARALGPLDKQRAAELEQIALTTAKQDSRHAFPSYVLGHVALARNDKDTAQRWFKVATHRDPTNKDAAEQLAQLSRRR